LANIHLPAGPGENVVREAATKQKHTKGADKAPFLVVAGPGFEPVPPAASKNLQVLQMNDFKGFRKRKSA
jgi:hypothetical protein